jgi:L-amino acid N-acyltransferase YncA
MTATIRLATAHDAPGVQAIYAPVVRETAISFEWEPPTVDDMGKRIGEVVERMPWLVCEHRGEVLGYAYASPHRVRAAYQWSMDVSVYIHAQARLSGVGRGLYRSLFALLILQGFYHADAGITPPNPSGSTAPSAINWGPGTLSGGGSSRCKSVRPLPNLRRISAPCASLRHGTRRWPLDWRACGCHRWE